MYPYLLQGKNIVIVIDNQPHTIGPTHIAYEKIKQALKDQDWTSVRDLINPRKVMLNYGQGNVSIQGETLFWRGNEMHNALSTRMISMLTEGFNIEPLVLFMENLYQNPSKRAVDELYGFLEKNNLPITPDGHFLAYKKVRKNFKDIYTGTIDNSVGEKPKMPRNEVCDDKDKTCSDGLHFCAESYLKHFGANDDPVIIIKANPRDVVSVPSDYNNAKGRCCEYEVIGVLGVAPEEAFTSVVQENANTASTDWNYGF